MSKRKTLIILTIYTVLVAVAGFYYGMAYQYKFAYEEGLSYAKSVYQDIGESVGYTHGYAEGVDSGYNKGWLDCDKELDVIIEQLRRDIGNLEKDDMIEWHNVKELEVWLSNNGIAYRDYENTVYDCDNFAIDLTLLAAKDNRYIGLYKTSNNGTGHLSNFAIIYDKLYNIEPQSNEITILSIID